MFTNIYIVFLMINIRLSIKQKVRSPLLTGEEQPCSRREPKTTDAVRGQSVGANIRTNKKLRNNYINNSCS